MRESIRLLDVAHAYYYAALQGQGGITCTTVRVMTVDVLQAGRTICLDGGDTTFSVKNSIFKAKSNQYAFSGYKHAKPTFENSLVELESKDIVMRGPTFGTISGFTKITATDKNGNVATYRPGDDLSTLSTDSRKVVIESQIHSHCVCGGKIAHRRDIRCIIRSCGHLGQRRILSRPRQETTI